MMKVKKLIQMMKSNLKNKKRNLALMKMEKLIQNYIQRIYLKMMHKKDLKELINMEVLVIENKKFNYLLMIN